MISSSEVMALVFGENIENIPKINKDAIEEKILFLRQTSDVEGIDSIVDTFLKESLTRLSLVSKLDNKPDSVFNYLVSYIRLDVGINSYLASNKLRDFATYCDGVYNCSNQVSIELVKRLIRRKSDGN